MNQLPISILYFSNEFTRGGAEEHMLTLLRGLDRSRFRPFLACPPELIEKMRPDLPHDVEVFPLCLRRPSQVQAVLKLAGILRKHEVQVLHSHLFYASLFASPIGWVCGVPVIIETPHVREDWRKGWFKSRFFVDRFASQFVTKYIAVSEANQRYLLKEKRLEQKKVVVIRNGSDLRRFHPEQRVSPTLRQSLGFEADDPILMVVGRLEPQKGHGILLEALPVVCREFPSVRLMCLGEGSLQDGLLSRTRELGIEENVRFVGFKDNVAEWLSLADLTVLPSFYEGLPLVAIESLAAGIPVIATAVDGTAEVVVDGKTGLTVPPGDSAALSAAICRLLRDRELRKQMARQGREWVCRYFDEREQIRQTQDLYFQCFQQAAQMMGKPAQVVTDEMRKSSVRTTEAGGRP